MAAIKKAYIEELARRIIGCLEDCRIYMCCFDVMFQRFVMINPMIGSF